MSRSRAFTADAGRSRLASARQYAIPVAALSCGLLVVALLHRLSHELDYHGMVRALRQMPNEAIGLSIGATILSFLALVGRELCGLRYVGARVPPTVLLIASVCGNALANAVGLGALSGGAIRYRMYRSVGLSVEAVGGIVAFISLGSGIDVVFLAALSSIAAAPAVGLLYRVPTIAVEAVAWPLVAASVLLVVFWTAHRKALRLGNFVLQFPPPRLFLAQLVFTAFDVVAAAASLWVLLPTERLELLPFAAIFTVASGLGLISPIPGGLGVFDALVIAALSHRVSPDDAAAAVLAYRGIYFLLPLMISAALLVAFELRGAAARTNSAIERIAVRAVPALTSRFIGVLVFAMGGVLMVSGATPGFGSRLAALQSVLPLWTVESAHFLASIDGIVLLFVVPGLFRRLDGAWWTAVILMLMNCAFALAKGLAYDEAGITVFVLLILLAGKPEFTRRASLLTAPITPGWWVSIAIVIAGALSILFFAFRDTPYSQDLWWQFEFDAQAPRALRATIAASTLGLATAVWQLLRPSSGLPPRPTPEEMARAEAIIRAQDRAEAMLALMGDKSFLFSPSGKAMLAYGKHGRSWIALYDPVGPKEEWRDLIRRFVELADDHGGRAAFYEIGTEALPLYLDAGLNIIKIGEEARIPLRAFSLQGGHRAALRNTLARGERDGLTVEFAEPSSDPSVVAELHAVSDTWLDHRRSHEMAFSVAGFHDAYVAKQHLAILRQNGKIIGLLSLMTTAHKTDVTIGVMRHMNEAPPDAMRFLVTKVIVHLQTDGFEWLSLGMAPLAGVERRPLASLWHHIAELVWQRGNRFYNFQGLRAFKDKFHPVWQPRYHAASGTVGPFIALADVAALANSTPWRSAT